MTTKSLLKDNILYIALGVTIAIAYLSLKEIDYYAPNALPSDKIQHAFAYCVLTICWLGVFRKYKATWLVLASCAFYGIILEILQQYFTTYRTGEVMDVVANITGIVVAFVIFKGISKKNIIN